MKHIADNLYEKKWGVFIHFLDRHQNNPQHISSNGECTSWNQCVDNFDVDKLAKNLHKINAGYVFITLMQGSKYMIAPNETYDRICGTNPGEACSTRDLVEDLYQALSGYGIDLYLYYTGDGPYKDEILGKAMGYTEPRELGVTETFVNNWVSVLEEYALRYKDKIKGWWIDGCYRDYFKYTDDLLTPYCNTIKKGNPNAIVTFNNGIENGFYTTHPLEEFTSGEQVTFDNIPNGRFTNNAQNHLLIPIGYHEDPAARWCSKGLMIDKEALANYSKSVIDAGGVLTFDVYFDRNSDFDPVQVDALKNLNI